MAVVPRYDTNVSNPEPGWGAPPISKSDSPPGISILGPESRLGRASLLTSGGVLSGTPTGGADFAGEAGSEGVAELSVANERRSTTLKPASCFSSAIRSILTQQFETGDVAEF